jgi:uncharacterized protein (TIGR02145 family)
MNGFKLVLVAAGFLLALSFTVSCSGDDGKDGASCVLAGNVLTCGSTSYTLPEGGDGEPGAPGAGCTLDDSDANGTVKQKCGGKEVIILCGGSPFNAKTQICDARDGNAYKFVDIDGNVWLAENLNFKTAGSVCYKNLPSNCAKYGRLYSWAEAKGACPTGWSLPEATEFAALIASAGDEAGKNLKSEEVGGSDSLGFGALFSSYRTNDFGNETESRFWSTTDNDDMANSLDISDNANLSNRPKANMNSVRCIKN